MNRELLLLTEMLKNGEFGGSSTGSSDDFASFVALKNSKLMKDKLPVYEFIYSVNGSEVENYIPEDFKDKNCMLYYLYLGSQYNPLSYQTDYAINGTLPYWLNIDGYMNNDEVYGTYMKLEFLDVNKDVIETAYILGDNVSYETIGEDFDFKTFYVEILEDIFLNAVAVRVTYNQEEEVGE